MPDQDQQQDQSQDYLDAQDYQDGQQDYQTDQDQTHDQDDGIDMDFDPPGSAVGVPSDNPFGAARDSALGSEGQEDGSQGAQVEGQNQGQDDLYSPGLSAEPSGSYMAEPGFQSEFHCSASPVVIWAA